MSKYALYGIFLQSLLCSMLLAENSAAQKSIEEIYLQVSVKDATIEDVFKKIEQHTDFEFVYKENVLGIDDKFTVNFTERSLGDVLRYLSIEAKLRFKRVNENISVVRIAEEQEKLPQISEEFAAQVKISGTVTSAEDDEPLPGVSILVKGTQKGTTTNFDGNYSIEVSPGSVLQFSYIGYLTKEVNVSNQSTINVGLDADLEQLEEVVVVGYGAVKKSDLTGSVASLKQEDVISIPTNNVLESMQGKVSGMDIVRSSGQVGSAVNITVRGNRSLIASNAPLILVDGISYGSDVNINPNDVESIEVLKDASSTAIYGSRGANGVIMITTKKGKSGKPTVSLNVFRGVNTITNYPTLTNTQQYVAQRREAYRATDNWSSPADDVNLWTAEELERINQGISTDWYDVLYDEGLVQDYQASLTGGNENTKISLSLDYYNEKGIITNDELNRYNGRFNINQKLSDKIDIGTSMFFSYSKTNARRSQIFDQVQKMYPTGIPYEEDGSIKVYPFANGTDVNPLVDGNEDNYINETLAYRTFSTTTFNYKIIDGLVFNSNLGLNVLNSRNGIFEGVNSTAAQSNKGLSRAVKSTSQSRNITWENTLTYDKTLGKHNFVALLGNSYINNYSEDTYAEGKDLGFEQAQFHNLDGTQQDFFISSNLIETSLLSYFGRVNYKFNDKYLATFTFRADGSSVLGDNNKWGYFPSAALAWRVIEENFLASSTLLSDLKVRTSLGVSGNTAVSAYQTSGGLGRTIYSFDETAAYGYRPEDLSNEDLKWEKTKVLNAGLDFGFIGNRITGTIDVYKTWTQDLLMTQLIPSHTGYESVIGNVGKTETKGVDISLSSVNIEKADFSWNTDVTFTANKEKITKLNSDQDDVANAWFIGQPTQVLYDYNKIGIWQLNEEAAAAEFGQAPGDIKVQDVNGDNVITADDDRVIVGQATPKWTAGITNRFNYKGIELQVFIIARVGQTIMSEAARHFRPATESNSAVVDYWTPENPTNAYPRPNSSKTTSNMLYHSTLGYRNGDFMKIKTLTLAYNFQPNVLGKLGLSNWRVYATAKNYFTFSHFDDYDPERGGSSSYPMTKQLVFGTNISF